MTKVRIGVGLGAVAVALCVLAYCLGPWQADQQVADQQVTDQQVAGRDGQEQGELNSGEAKDRKARERDGQAEAEGVVDASQKSQPLDYGRTPWVKVEDQPMLVSVREALVNQSNPERATPEILPAAFDQAGYRRDPEAYLSVIEPGRVFQPAQPGPDVTPIRASSSLFHTVVQGEQVRLQVDVPPGMPVTFTSFDLGRFAESELASVTVAADENGLATATFYAPPGTIAAVNIMAASPVTSGQLRFQIRVTLPESQDAR